MIEKKDIEKLATLARIKVSEQEAESLGKEIDSILGYVSELKDINISGFEGAPSDLPVKNVLRADGEPHETGTYTDAILKEMPTREGNHLKVKKILG